MRGAAPSVDAGRPLTTTPGLQMPGNRLSAHFPGESRASPSRGLSLRRLKAQLMRYIGNVQTYRCFGRSRRKEDRNCRRECRLGRSGREPRYRPHGTRNVGEELVGPVPTAWVAVDEVNVTRDLRLRRSRTASDLRVFRRLLRMPLGEAAGPVRLRPRLLVRYPW